MDNQEKLMSVGETMDNQEKLMSVGETMDNQEKLMSVSEFKKLAGLTDHAAYCLARSRDFPSIKVGRRYYIIRDKIDEYFEKASKKKN